MKKLIVNKQAISKWVKKGAIDKKPCPVCGKAVVNEICSIDGVFTHQECFTEYQVLCESLGG